MDKSLKAIVVGCGSIGALKPNKYDRPGGKRNILTHAHAYQVSSDVELVGLVDTDEEKAKTAAKKWRTVWENDIGVAMKRFAPDIVSICAPTELHNKLIHQILASGNKPKLIVAEKPFCSNLEEASAVVGSCRRAHIPLLVNYTRRFSLEHGFIKRKIERGDLGEIYHARLLYGRGLMRDGCHGIDMFRWFFGDPILIEATGSRIDHLQSDPTIDIRFVFPKCRNVWMVGTNSKVYGMFEIEILSEKERIVFGDNGTWINTCRPVEEKTYGKYFIMPSHSKDMRRTDLTNSLSRMVSNAARHITHQEPLMCTGEDALAVHKIMANIRRLF